MNIDLARSQLFIGMHIPNNNRAMKFHADIWLRSEQSKKDTLVFTVSQETKIQINGIETGIYDSVLVFNDAVAYERFRLWWGKYSARYSNGVIHSELPSPPSNKISGYIVKHYEDDYDPYRRVLNPVEFTDQWGWMIENCQGNIYWTSACWIFEDENDAVMYKLNSEPSTDESNSNFSYYFPAMGGLTKKGARP